MVRVLLIILLQSSLAAYAQTSKSAALPPSLPTLPFDDIYDCRPDRLYLQGDIQRLQKMDTEKSYFATRSTQQVATSIPRQCIQYSMQSYAVDWLKISKPSTHMARCDSDSGFPVVGNYVPCLTEDYVNMTYNSFVDVTDCIDVSQKMVIPKIFDESGFHSNAFNPVRKKMPNGQWSTPYLQLPPKNKRGYMTGGDTGVGQLTADGIEDVKQNIDTWKSEILNSTKPSCQRIVKFLKEIPGPESIDSSLDQRCSLIKTPSNPVLNMLFSGILFRRMTQTVRDNWGAMRIDSYLSSAGYTANQTERNKLKQMITLLGYSVGPGTALIYFKNWLNFRLNEVPFKPLNRSDFTFEKEGASQLRDQHMSFAHFLQVNQKEAVRDYLARLKDRAQSLDRNVGKAVCTDALYLSL